VDHPLGHPGAVKLHVLYIDTYPDYKPHITLAYLKADSGWQAYVEPLSDRLRGASVKAVGLNYDD
jgi:hypothetical protein